jgi:hypothetical protein
LRAWELECDGANYCYAITAALTALETRRGTLLPPSVGMIRI